MAVGPLLLKAGMPGDSVLPSLLPSYIVALTLKINGGIFRAWTRKARCDDYDIMMARQAEPGYSSTCQVAAPNLPIASWTYSHLSSSY